jgi:hypothetical protein
MAILCWVLIIVSFVVSFVGLVYPIIPSVLFVALGFVIYGLFYDFSSYKERPCTTSTSFISLSNTSSNNNFRVYLCNINSTVLKAPVISKKTMTAKPVHIRIKCACNITLHRIIVIGNGF